MQKIPGWWMKKVQHTSAKYPEIPGYIFATAHGHAETDITASIKTAYWLNIAIDDVLTLELNGDILENRWASYIDERHKDTLVKEHQRIYKRVNAIEEIERRKYKYVIDLIEDLRIEEHFAEVLQLSDLHYRIYMHPKTAQHLKKMSGGFQEILYLSLVKKLGLQ